MTGATNEELEGNTLTVYAYVARENRPVGTREVTRGANLSSPSVAHRHLLKLEARGLLEKNKYGDYMLKYKTGVNGYVWVGSTLVPRLMFYSIFFAGALTSEMTIVLLSFLTRAFAVETTFIFLVGITVLALVMFLFEAVSMHRKIINGRSKENCEENEEP